MASNNNLENTCFSFELTNKNVKKFRANYEYIGISTKENTIEIYSINSLNKLYSHVFLNIIDFQFHPKYNNVFAVTLAEKSVVLCHINIIKKIIEQKVKYIGSSCDILDQTIFSPYKDGNYLASLYHSSIRIWDMNRHYCIYIININDLNRLYKSKWSQSGTYLIYPKNQTRIEIFSLKSKSIEYYLDSDVINSDDDDDDYIHDFYIVEKPNEILILIIKDQYILAVSPSRLNNYNNKNQIKLKIQCLSIISVKSKYDYNNSFLYLFHKRCIFLYDLNQGKCIFKYKLKTCEEFFILNGDNNTNLISKLIIRIKENKFLIISIISKENIKFNYQEMKESPENFWKNSIKKISNDYEFLSFKNNIEEDDEINPKKYISIDDINQVLENSIKNETLDQKKEIVKRNIEEINKNEDKNISYLDYIKNLIKDNTNTELLINYLKYLKNEEKVLNQIYKDNFENFNDEISQYEVCFTQSELQKELNYDKKKSELEKFKDLLIEISKLELDKKNIDKLDKFIELKKEELDKFRFNQPISFENEELYFCRNRMVILYSLQRIIEEKKYLTLKNMKYCIEKIFERKFLKNKKIIGDFIKLNIIILSIAVPQRESITDYNLNLIDNDGIDTTEEELIDLKFKFDKFNNSYQYEDLLAIEKDKINLYNLKNIKTYIKDSSICSNNYELYKYDYLNDYYKTKYDEENIRKFLKKILLSNVFKEAFSFFYGGEVKYPFSNEKDSKIYLDKYLKFIPFKSETTHAITEKFSMETYIFLNDNLIQLNLLGKNNKINAGQKLAIKALINGAIVEIFYHELNHNFHNYYFCLKNGYESLKTPRKNETAEREGGENMERILFDKIVHELTLGQAFFILNEKNYEKSLNQFRNEFIMLKKEEFEDDSIFKEYKDFKMEMEQNLDYMVIRFKNNKFNNIYNIKYISIKLKDDAI